MGILPPPLLLITRLWIYPSDVESILAAGANPEMSHYDPQKSQKLYQQAPVKNEGPIFSLNAKKNGNKFMSHLLGLDHEEQNSKVAPQNVFKGIKISDLFQGIKITPNFLFLCLFMGLFFWLFVIYWVRHHEPLANQVLGTPKVDPQRAAIDMKLVAGVKQAFPVQTSSTTGEIYVPGSPVAAYQSQEKNSAPPAQTAAGQNTSPQSPDGTQFAATTPNTPAVLAQAQAQSAYVAAPAQTGYPAGTMSSSALNPQMQYSHYGAMQQNYAAMSSMPGRHGSYIIGIQTETGNTRARTVVSR